MTFIWMEALWLLLIIPLLILGYIWLMRRRKQQALRFASLSVVKQAMGRGGSIKRHLPPIIMLVALTLLIISVARPAAVVTLASARGTIILAMDVSGSMRAEDVDPNRLKAAQDAAKKFITTQPPNVQIGVVSFAGTAVLVQPPTIDREALFQSIDRFQYRRGTAVGAGVLQSLATIFPDDNFNEVESIADDPWGSFSRQTFGAQSSENGFISPSEVEGMEKSDHVPVEPGSFESAVVILLTDGATTTGPDPIAAGELAGDYGVRIFTVGFGSPAGEVISVAGRSMRAQLDAESLKAIAKSSEGEYFEATSSEDLEKVYGSLSTRLVAEKKLTEISFIFGGAAALLVMISAALSMLWYGRVS